MELKSKVCQIVEMSFLGDACGVKKSNESVHVRFSMDSMGEGMSCGMMEVQHPEMVLSPGQNGCEWDETNIIKSGRDAAYSCVRG